MPEDIKTEQSKADISISLDFERYAKLLEIDLWSRLQNRIWAITGVVLTSAALLGLFGIPAVIDNKINQVFSDRLKKFDTNVDNYLSLYRTYFHIQSLVVEYRFRLDAQARELADHLERKSKARRKIPPG